MIRNDTIRSLSTHRPIRPARVLAPVLAVLALAAVGLAFATQPSFEPAVDDAGFTYYEQASDTNGEKVAFVSWSVENGTLTVHVAGNASPGAVATTFDAVPGLSSARFDALFGAPDPGERTVQAEARSDEQDRLRKAAGMAPLGQGWRIVHRDTSLNDAVAAYEDWMSAAGLTMTPDTAHTQLNVRPFSVDGLATPLRLVFHRQGSGVRVYVGAR